MDEDFEGLCSLTAVKGSGAFFNSLQLLQRDLSVLCLRTYLDGGGGACVLDAMCGGGVRAVRYALEVPAVAACVAVDLNPASVATARLTVARSGPRGGSGGGRGAPAVEVVHGDCNAVMAARGRGFEAVDLDPCGSPTPFLAAAVRACVPGGLLCVASTEDPALDPGLCFRRYGGRCFGREVAVAQRSTQLPSRLNA
jgi:tRNA (guanine26-N2/guanine27-N2)-dimethyltransferase